MFETIVKKNNNSSSVRLLLQFFFFPFMDYEKQMADIRRRCETSGASLNDVALFVANQDRDLGILKAQRDFFAANGGDRFGGTDQMAKGMLARQRAELDQIEHHVAECIAKDVQYQLERDATLATNEQRCRFAF